MSIARGWSSSLLRHTSRGQNVAMLDRYDTIRRFFKGQYSTHSLFYNTTTSELVFTRIYAQNKHIRLYRRPTRPCSRELTWTACNRVERGQDSSEQNTKSASQESSTLSSSPVKDPQKNGHDGLSQQRLDNYPRLFRRLAMSLPHLHRPTRDDFLNAANGFWQRARVRFRWLTIRSFRKYNADDISAFVTWFFMSQTLWLLVGT